MAYQNVGSTPRFYVSILQWLHSLGEMSIFPSSTNVYGKHYNELAYLDPIKTTYFKGAGGAFNINFNSLYGNYNTLMPNDKNFFMLLNHNFSKGGMQFYLSPSPPTTIANIGYKNVQGIGCHKDGFSISLGNDAGDMETNELILRFQNYVPEFEYYFGSVLYGTYYDIPRSPSLNVKLSRDYGSTKEYETITGASISNTYWDTPPHWSDGGAWELINHEAVNYEKLSKSGRRTRDLSFQMMTDSDVLGANQKVSYRGENLLGIEGYEDADTVSNVTFAYNLLDDDNFFSQVWNKTANGTLPFVFQQDSSNSSADQFAIARFKTDTLSIKQSSIGLMDISVTIEEAW